MTFYSFRCPKCGKWGSKEIRSLLNILKAIFKCVYCGKSTKIKKKSIGLALDSKGPYGSGIEVANITKQNNAR